MATRAKKSSPNRTVSAVSDQKPATEKDVQVRVFKGHTGPIWRVAMTEDGNLTLTSGYGGVLRWELGEASGESKVVRAELAERLIASLANEVPLDITSAQVAEVQRRVAQVESGEVTLIAGDEVLAKARDLLKEHKP